MQQRKGGLRSLNTSIVLALLAGCSTPAVTQSAPTETVVGKGGNTATHLAPGSDTAKVNPTTTAPGLLPANPIAVGASHKGEVTVPEALADVAPIHVNAALGLKYVSPDGNTIVNIPPGALDSDAELRIKPSDTSVRPLLKNLVPGISYYMDLGTAQIGVDQAISVTSKVDSRAIAEMKTRDPHFDPAKYSLSQNASGTWMLQMNVPGPQSQPLAPQPKSDTPYVLTVETADRTLVPITIFKQDGHAYSNTGRQLLCADGCDHTAGFYTYEDLEISKITDWVSADEEAGYRLVDDVKALDKNGNPITMQLSQFSPTTHQQNCDFADAGCPDSGAKAQIALKWNHILSFPRFPGDMVYPATTSDGKPNPLAGQPFPGAGLYHRPPDDMKKIVDKIQTLGTCVPPTCQNRVYGQAIWRSDDASINGTPAGNPNAGVTAADLATDKIFLGFKGLAGAAGGETTVVGRERPVDQSGKSFETMACSAVYNLFGYFKDRRFPSGIVAGGVRVGEVEGGKDYASAPFQVNVPRYNPMIALTLLGEDKILSTGTKATIQYSVDGGPAQTAMEIVPPTHPGDVPGSQTPVIRLASNGRDAQEIDFYGKLPDDNNHTFQFTKITLETDQAVSKPDSLRSAVRVFNPSDIHSGVFRNGIFSFEIQMVSNIAKYSLPLGL